MKNSIHSGEEKYMLEMNTGWVIQEGGLRWRIIFSRSLDNICGFYKLGHLIILYIHIYIYIYLYT